MLQGMIFSRYADLFEICWPVFWPWLWLQLSILTAQKAEDGRPRLIMGTWWGKVYVLAVGDDPNAPPNDPFSLFRAPSSTLYSTLIAAKFPGDTPALAHRTAPMPHTPRGLFLAPTGLCASALAAFYLLDKSFVSPPG